MFDTQWGMPGVGWAQQGSFLDPATPPIDPPDGGDLVSLGCVNKDWVKLIVGALDQLRNPSSWLATLDDAGRAEVLNRVDLLLGMITGMDACVNPLVDLTFAGCTFTKHFADGTTGAVVDWDGLIAACVKGWVPPQVPVPAVPGAPGQNACAIATYLEGVIFTDMVTSLYNALHTGQTVDSWIRSVVEEITTFAPILGFITGPFLATYQTALPQPLSDLLAASTDTTLQANVVCAIYNAIKAVGYVDGTNFAAVATNIAAISYAHAWVPTMIANFWTNMGLPSIQQIQAQGSITSADCSACTGTWCHYFDFTVNSQGWQARTSRGVYVPGTGWKSQAQGGSPNYGILEMYYDFGISRTVTELQWNYSTPNGHTGTQSRELGVFDNVATGHFACFGLTPFNGSSPGYTWESVSAGLCGGRYPGMSYTNVYQGPGTEIICAGVQVRGTGPNPFGPDNCVVGP